jgi:hypothetical protein
MKVHNSEPHMRAGTRELEAYVWVMVKRLGAVNCARNLSCRIADKQVHLFLCRKFCNDFNRETRGGAARQRA